jgi:hypothetical protein
MTVFGGQGSFRIRAAQQRRFDPKLYLVPFPQNRVFPTKSKYLVSSNEDQIHSLGAHLAGLSIYLERSLHSLWCLFRISLRVVSMDNDKEVSYGILVEGSD